MVNRAYRGKHLTLLVRFPNQGRQVEDIELWSHTNETIGQLRRQLIARSVFLLLLPSVIAQALSSQQYVCIFTCHNAVNLKTHCSSVHL